jgi:hypothetical protein
MFFKKEDEMALRKLLRKAKAQADAAGVPVPSSAEQLQGGYGGDTESIKQGIVDSGESGGASAQGVSAPAGGSREREALRGIVDKYGLKAEDVEALLAWRASSDF